MKMTLVQGGFVHTADTPAQLDFSGLRGSESWMVYLLGGRHIARVSWADSCGYIAATVWNGRVYGSTYIDNRAGIIPAVQARLERWAQRGVYSLDSPPVVTVCPVEV